VRRGRIDEMDHGNASGDREQDLCDVEDRLNEWPPSNCLGEDRCDAKRQDHAAGSHREHEQHEKPFVQVVRLGGAPLVHHDRPEPAGQHEGTEDREQPDRTEACEMGADKSLRSCPPAGDRCDDDELSPAR